MKILIPMAGYGSRFQAANYKDPKPLIKVDGKPMIEHVINLFNHSDSDKDTFIFICNEEHLRETEMRSILLSLRPHAKIIGISPHKKGPVYTVSLCLDEIFDDENTNDEEIIISYCDYGTDWSFDNFLKEMHNFINNYDSKVISGAIACYKGFHPHMLGTDNYAFVKEIDREVLEIQEKKPYTNNRMNEYASNGTYYFRHGRYVTKYFRELINRKIEINGEYYISLVYNLMIEDNLRVRVYEIDHMLQWGTPFDLKIYQMWSDYFHKLLIRGEKEERVQMKHPEGTTLVLPLAGRGNRFVVQGYDLPKPLLSIEGEAMIIQAVRSIPICDSYSFVCLSSHIQDYHIDKLLRSKFMPANLIGIDEVTQGQACTCELVVKTLDLEKPICISACDNGVLYNAERYKKLLEDEDVDVIVWSFRNNPTSVNNPDMYAWLDVDKDDKIRHVSVKKYNFKDDPRNHHAIIGTMFFRKARYFMEGLEEIYEQEIRTNGEFYVDDLLNPLIRKGLTLKVFECDFYICWGTPDDYKTYQYWSKYFNSLLNHS